MLFKLVPCLHAQLTDDILRKFNINPNQKVADENVVQLKEVNGLSDYEYRLRIMRSSTSRNSRRCRW